MKKAYRHGDVLVLPDGIIPKHAKKLDNLILAYGEVTGHKHQISNGLAHLFEHGSTKFLRVLSDNVDLVHEEHKTITLPQGDYEVRIQREYSPEGWRNVAD